MLTREEINIIMHRNDSIGLYCRHDEEIRSNNRSEYYNINIRNIPRDKDSFIYLYEVNGPKCQAVSIDNIYLIIHRETSDDKMVGFEVDISEYSISGKYDVHRYSVYGEIIKLEDFFTSLDAMEKFKDSYQKTHIYTAEYIGVMSISDYNLNEDSVWIKSTDGTIEANIPKNHIWIYSLYPMISSDQSCIIYAKDIDEIIKIVNFWDLYNTLHGEYIDHGANKCIKAYTEVAVNIKTKEVFNGFNPA